VVKVKKEGGVVVHGASALKRRVKRQPCWSWMRTSGRVRRHKSVCVEKAVLVGGKRDRRFGRACSGSERGWWLIRRRRAERKVRSTSSRSWGLSAAAPCGPRKHVPPGHEVPTEPSGKSLSFLFLSFWVFICASLCV